MKNLLSYIEKGQLKKFINYFEGNFSGLDADSTFVLEKGGPKRSVPWNHTLFSYSCRHGKLEICKYLSSKVADPIGKKSSIGKGFPLAISVFYNHFHVSDWLQKEFNIDCSINYSWPLTMSAEYGNLDGVKYALKHNADIHSRKDYALELAAYYGHLDIVKYLISRGADVHGDNECILAAAVDNGHLDIVQYLLSKGADVFATSAYVLQRAVERRDLEMLKCLVEHGADVHAQDNYALKISVENNLPEFVEYLVSKGADIHAGQDSPLISAVEEGNLDIVEFLVSKGANVQAQNNSALLWAVRLNHFAIAECLLDHGADPNAKNIRGPVLEQLIAKEQYSLAAKAAFYGADISLLSSSQQQKLNAYILPKKIVKARKL